MQSDQQEFARLVREHKSTIYMVCYMFSNDADEVADLFQEVLIKLWSGFKSFEGRSAVKTWVYRVALNTCISLDEKKKRRSKAREQLAMDIDIFTATDRNSEQARLLHSRINQLPPLDRALVLLWLEDISYDEIGAIVGISLKNVSVRLYRIRQQLNSMASPDND